MAKVAALRRWQPVPNTSRDFKIVNKLSNLGDYLYKKNILGSYINWNMDREGIYYYIDIYIREGTRKDWVLINSISASNRNFKRGSFNSTKMISDKMVVDAIQIKLEGTVRDGFDINDFGLIYRKQRTSSSGDLDED